MTSSSTIDKEDSLRFESTMSIYCIADSDKRNTTVIDAFYDVHKVFQMSLNYNFNCCSR